MFFFQLWTWWHEGTQLLLTLAYLAQSVKVYRRGFSLCSALNRTVKQEKRLSLNLKLVANLELVVLAKMLINDMHTFPKLRPNV